MGNGVKVFLEGHKKLQNLHRRFDELRKCQIAGEDFTIFCGLLRKHEHLLAGTKLPWFYQKNKWTFRKLL